MKKLLAILMALMLVMVSAFALAGGVDPDVNSPEEQDLQNLNEEDPKKKDPNSEQPATSPNSGSADSYLPEKENEDEFSNKEKVSESNPLNNEANVTVTLKKAINVEGYENTGAAPAQYITFTAAVPEQDYVTNNSVDVAKKDVPVVTFSDVNLAKGETTGDITITITGTAALVCYIMYTVSPEVMNQFKTPYLYLTSIFVLVGLLRYIQLAVVDKKSGDPTKIILKDRFTQLIVLAWGISFLILIYF